MRVYQFRHIRVSLRGEDIARAAPGPWGADSLRRELRGDGLPARTCSVRFASLDRADCAPLSSRGLGRRPLMAETRVRIPVAVLDLAP